MEEKVEKKWKLKSRQMCGNWTTSKSNKSNIKGDESQDGDGGNCKAI